MALRTKLVAPLMLALSTSPALAQAPAAPAGRDTDTKPAAPTTPATPAPTATTPRPSAPQATAPRPAIDPTVVAALERMGGYLRGITAMGIRAEHTTDEVLENGQKIERHGTVDMKVRRPDRLRADLTSDTKSRQYFYDGKSFTIYAPRERYYSTVAAPPALRDLVSELSRRYDLELPLADLFYWGTEESGISDLRTASNVGPSTIGGVVCDHYAFRQADVDWQIWIQRGAQPLPRKLVITTTDEPAQPQHVVTMAWDLQPRLDERMFVFTPPRDASRIDMRVVSPTDIPRQGRTAPRK
jgi:hypothetical protein